ncbi:MAG TPA: YfbR-like 5'-deoxynucleotidase [bacterium]|nr:YfbR-like 5'-deoxynucleotidase [bacterium]
MADTFVSAIGDLMRLQRWNVKPRVVFWNEAENVAYTAHVAYALGRIRGMSTTQLEHVLARTLLKSLNKHYLSDVLVDTRDELRKLDPEIWRRLVDKAADVTAALFPRDMLDYAKGYMTLDGNYGEQDGKLEPSRKKEIEELITFAQYKVAIRECETNRHVDPGRYVSAIRHIKTKISRIEGRSELENSYKKIGAYVHQVENLKHLRRWNLLNRAVETSVLGHTFIVGLLALTVARQCKSVVEANAHANVSPFLEAILRALFHDVPEAVTGDIVTPVKEIINTLNPKIVERLEKNMTKDFVATLPGLMKRDVEDYNLLKELDDRKPYSVSSLVKACDRLALVLECLFETETGQVSTEMTSAYGSYITELQNSEWPPIRELCTRILLEHPRKRLR